MLLPTQPDHLLSVCGDGRGQNCLAISSPRRTGQALTAPYVSITFNIPVPLCVSYSPEVPNSSPPPAPLSPPPPEMTPTCIWLQVLWGGVLLLPPTPGWLLCCSVPHPSSVGTNNPQGQACLPFTLGPQTTAQNHQGPVSSGLGTPSLVQASETSSLLVSPANRGNSTKIFYLVCSAVQERASQCIWSTQNQVPAPATQNETRVPRGPVVGHTLIATLGYLVGHPINTRFTLQRENGNQWFKEG